RPRSHISSLSLHDALPISSYKPRSAFTRAHNSGLSPPSPRPINNNTSGSQATQKPKFTKLTNELRQQLAKEGKCFYCRKPGHRADRKSTRLNSSHVKISYA